MGSAVLARLEILTVLYAPFIDGSGKSASLNFQLDTLWNMYLENRTMAAARSDKALVGAPGTKPFYDFGNGPIRGQLSIEGYDFIVSAGNVWVKDPADVVTLLGVVANDNKPVKMVANNQKIFLRSAGFGYQVSGVVTPVPLPPWTTLADIAHLHGYYIALDDDGSPTGGQFFISALNDPLTWNALDFSTVPSTADKLRALATSHDQLDVIGSIITQPFYDSGNADFPLVPNQSGTMEVGTVAKDSVCAVGTGPRANDNVIYFMSETLNGHCQLMKLVGFNPVVVSTPPIEAVWQKARQADVERVVLWTFQENGHFFIQVCWPQDSPTPLGSQRYDATTDRWADVSWLNPATGANEAHRGINHGFNLTRHLVGDRSAGILWEMNTDLYDDRDPTATGTHVPMISYRECLLTSEGTKTMFISRVELLGETGVGDGTGSGPGDDPQVMLEMSGNGGHNYDPNPEQISMGKMGDYDARMVWTGIGSFRQPAIRISSSAPVKKWWSGLQVDIKAGVS